MKNFADFKQLFIQKYETELAKTVEQIVRKEIEDVYNENPLPNLDTKIVAATSSATKANQFILFEALETYHKWLNESPN